MPSTVSAPAATTAGYCPLDRAALPNARPVRSCMIHQMQRRTSDIRKTSHKGCRCRRPCLWASAHSEGMDEHNQIVTMSRSHPNFPAKLDFYYWFTFSEKLSVRIRYGRSVWHLQ